MTWSPKQHQSQRALNTQSFWNTPSQEISLYAYLENRPGTRRLEVLNIGLNGKWWKNQLGHGCFKRSVPETWHGNHMNSWNCHAAVKTHNMSKTCPNHLQIWATWCYLTIIFFKQGYKKKDFFRDHAYKKGDVPCGPRNAVLRSVFHPCNFQEFSRRILSTVATPKR